MGTFKTTHYKIKIADPELAPSQPFSAAVLADLHNVSYGEQNELLLQAVCEADPKLVLSAGDLVVSKLGEPGTDAAVALLGELTRRYPVYCVNGNHESRMDRRRAAFGEAYDSYIQQIRSLGVHFLQNSAQLLEVNRTKLAVFGYELEWKYYGRGRAPKLSVQDMRDKLGEPEPGAYHILLAHHPDYFRTYARWGADLVLAGHVHGGVVRLPGVGGLVSPSFTLFPKYDRGLYTEGGKKMIVSAGLGSHTINLRINNPTELVIVDFV